MTPAFGNLIFSTRKSYGLVVFWFVFFFLPVAILVGSWLENHNPHALLFALLLYAPGFYLLADRLRSRLNIYQNSLEVQTLFGHKTMPFTPALKLYIGRLQERMYGVNTARHVFLRLESRDQRLSIPSAFLHLENVIELLLDYQSKAVLPALQHAFAEGKTLDFGVVKLNPRYLKIKDQMLPFAEISEIELLNGSLYVHTHNKHGTSWSGRGAARTELKHIANFDILNTFLQNRLPESAAFTAN